MIRKILVALLGLSVMAAAPPAKAALGNAYQFTFTSIDGKVLALAEFRGKTILIVNTASQCGFTKQYQGLQEIWEQYRDRGLIVIGVPSNDFGGQEPGSEQQIREFCTVNFDIDFPMTAKERVTGPLAHPFYRWAGKQLGLVAMPRWNFHKYLIGPDGDLVDWFSTATSPNSERVRKAIELSLQRSRG